MNKLTTKLGIVLTVIMLGLGVVVRADGPPSTLTLSGLEFSLDGLTFSAGGSADEFVGSGSAGFSFQGSNVSIQVPSGGLVLRENQNTWELVSLNASIPVDFQIGNLALVVPESDPLTLQYNDSATRFEIFGDLKVEFGADQFNGFLGDSSKSFAVAWVDLDFLGFKAEAGIEYRFDGNEIKSNPGPTPVCRRLACAPHRSRRCRIPLTWRSPKTSSPGMQPYPGSKTTPTATAGPTRSRRSLEPTRSSQTPRSSSSNCGAPRGLA